MSMEGQTKRRGNKKVAIFRRLSSNNFSSGNILGNFPGILRSPGQPILLFFVLLENLNSAIHPTPPFPTVTILCQVALPNQWEAQLALISLN